MIDTPPLPNRLKTEIHEALRQWYAAKEPPINHLSGLILVQNMRQQKGGHVLAAKRYFINEVLLEGLEQLGLQQLEGAQILRKRFLDKKSAKVVAQELELTEYVVKHRQKTALKDLTKTVWELECAARKARITTQKSSLEAKHYTAVFGIEELSDRLRDLLLKDDSPWVVTLVGLGGIGKTTLANYTVRRVIEHLHYHDVVWLTISDFNVQERPFPAVTPKQTFDKLILQLSRKLLPTLPNQTSTEERLTQVQQLLKSRPYLIIIDDLELRSDTAYLISQLVNVAQPSRFLLTSRTPPADHVGSQTICLPELGEADSLTLIRHYAREIGFHQAAEAKKEELLPIYELVGGNPYTLKQLVSLAKERPLQSLLTSLQERPLENGKEIYLHILEQTWLTLSDDAKAVLAVMPLAADGGMDPEQIAALSRLPDERLWPAINELIGRSLLEVRSSTIWERFYGIHRLTELFIRSLLHSDVSG
ncbi:MAG: hypothetical protein H6653_09255 [Ardenticatenaceae bacterium]|nr:hypothetical protein [Ardenticatenaceae bacterium]